MKGSQVKALRLFEAQGVEKDPLTQAELDGLRPGPGQLVLRIRASGVCHTDLHLVEGDIHPPRLPITPGHQIVGEVVEIGAKVEGWNVGERAGVPWLYSACRRCDYCQRGQENLCREAKFTGFDVDGGFAEAVISEADWTLKIPESIKDADLAPLLCAGIVGYRSLKKAEPTTQNRLGLVGFGASAHLAIQVAHYWGHEVYVFTRSEHHRILASELGAAWVGGVEDEPPEMLERAIIFAPVGALVPAILAKLRPAGILVLNAIHMTPIPEFPYRLIWEERTITSVANATYQDGVEFLELAAEIPIRATVEQYDLEQANQALRDLKASRISGAGVLIP